MTDGGGIIETSVAPDPGGPVFRGRIGVIGAGALGCYYGGKLSRAGHQVHFLLRSDYEAVRRAGLKVFSVDGDFHIHPPVAPTPAALGPCDLLLVGLKCTDNAALPALITPCLHARTLVLTLQNGFGNEETCTRIVAASMGLALPPEGAPLADYPRAARERVLGGVAFLCSNRVEPGVIHHSAYGWVRLAEAAGPATARTHEIARLFTSSGVSCEVSDEVARIRWEKLVWNIPFNGLGVGAGFAHTRSILESEPLVRSARVLMQEVLAAAAAEGIEIPPAFADKMIAVTEAMGPYKSSMQLDYEAGRPLEVEAILGEPLRRARRTHTATPVLELLYGIVKRLDALRRESGGATQVSPPPPKPPEAPTASGAPGSATAPLTGASA